MRLSESDEDASTYISTNSGETTPLIPYKSPLDEHRKKRAETYERLDAFFKITERGSTISTELKSGLTTFLTLSYIILVNPPLMSEAGLSLDLTTTGTCVASAITTLMIGIWANLPLGCAPGIGLTAYFTYGLVGDNVSPENALAASFLSGVVCLLFSVSGLSDRLLKYIPEYIKYSTIVGMGLLIAFIGLVDMGAVQRGETESLLKLGALTSWKLWLSFMSLFLLVTLYSRGIQSACLISLCMASLIYFFISEEWPTQFFDLPFFESPRRLLDFHCAPFSMSIGVASFFFVLLFDVSGVVYGCGHKCGLMDENQQILGAREVMISVSVGTILSALMGCSPMIVGVESMSGIATGGRTGLTAVVSAFLFLLSTFFRPLLTFIPSAATSPILVFVGIMMMEQVGNIDWQDTTIALPAFLTIVIMPFTYSISNGVFVGIISAVLMKSIKLFLQLWFPENTTPMQPMSSPRIRPSSSFVMSDQYTTDGITSMTLKGETGYTLNEEI